MHETCQAQNWNAFVAGMIFGLVAGAFLFSLLTSVAAKLPTKEKHKVEKHWWQKGEPPPEWEE